MGTIEVPDDTEVSCLAVSKFGLMAFLSENDQKLFIYNHDRRDVLEFPLDCPDFSYANQMAFDIYGNIIIAEGDRDTLLRFNMNGKALPHLEVPVNNPTGVACSPKGELFVSSNDPCTIVKQAVGQLNWRTIYRSQDDDDGEDAHQYEDDMDHEVDDPPQFTPGQMCIGSDGDLFVATDNCINVLNTFDGKVKRQIGRDRYGDGNVSKVERIFATGDGYLFVCSSDHNVQMFTTDGEYLNELGPGVFQHPRGMAVDWNGYLLISDVGNGKIKVF